MKPVCDICRGLDDRFPIRPKKEFALRRDLTKGEIVRTVNHKIRLCPRLLIDDFDSPSTNFQVRLSPKNGELRFFYGSHRLHIDDRYANVMGTIC